MVFNRDFDRRYQVTRMNGGSSDRRYTRDKNGRVTGITNVRTPGLAGLNAVLGYAGKSNRLEKISGAGAGKYAYDANGNTVSDGRHTFAYDALNRLVSVSVKNKVTARYTYDAWNRRTSKTAGGRTVHYHYDQDSRLIGESLANGTVLREYVYLRGEPVALLEYETRPGWYFYVTDHLGTPQQLVDSRGAVVWQAAYLPYGEARVLKATVQNNLRFPGQYFDAETGLHYNWNRYYNPKTGRYITADPIGLNGEMNVYAYAGGNPVNAVDVEGLTAEVISIPVFTINPQNITTPILAIPQISIQAIIISVVFYPTELADGTIPPGMFNDDTCKKKLSTMQSTYRDYWV